MRRAYRRKYHYIYKTTCTVTGKYYIGMHSTDDLDDGYVGSGKRLGYSIRKYGKENHKCEIIEHLPDRESLRKRESELVCEDKLTDPLCMNLKLGGDGGFDHILHHEDQREWAKAGRAQTTEILLGRGITQADLSKRGIDSARKQKKNVAFDPELQLKYSFAHNKELQQAGNSPEARAKASESLKRYHELHKPQLGDNNSQYGTCWVHSLTEKKSMKISKADLEAHLALGWQAGRKMKF
jgi:hypothetical protein